MTIAVHITLTDIQHDLDTNFNYNCFTILAARFPSQHFIFIFDRPFPASIITGENITPVLSGPQIKNRLLQHYFYNFKIPRLLNKYNADFFVSAHVCSLRTDVSQCLLIEDLSFLKRKNIFSLSDSRYLKKYTSFFTGKAAKLAVMNPYLIKTLVKSYHVPESKINVLQTGIDPVFKPASHESAEQTRKQLTDGKSYFLAFVTASSLPNIIIVLKAFSVFKKWQKSGMQLLILFSTSVKEKNIKDLSSYKYRNDVKIMEDENKQHTAAVIAAAYACIHLPEAEVMEPEGLTSLASAVPLIITDNNFNKAIYNDGVLYSATTETDVSGKMMQLYKDEKSRNKLIETGRLIASSHSWQDAAQSLWKTIEPVAAV